MWVASSFPCSFSAASHRLEDALRAARAGWPGPAGGPERRRPLPGVLGLPRRAWGGLSPGWRRVVVVLGVLSLAGLAIAIPAALRTGNDVVDAAREADARAEAARRRELIEEQRPRSIPVGAAVVNEVRRLGGGDRGRADGGRDHGRRPEPDPRRPAAELSVGYRFSGRADLAAAQLFWCKENPPPLHPTSIVVKVPLSTRCR